MKFNDRWSIKNTIRPKKIKYTRISQNNAFCNFGFPKNNNLEKANIKIECKMHGTAPVNSSATSEQNHGRAEFQRNAKCKWDVKQSRRNAHAKTQVAIVCLISIAKKRSMRRTLAARGATRPSPRAVTWPGLCVTWLIKGARSQPSFVLDGGPGPARRSDRGSWEEEHRASHPAPHVFELDAACPSRETRTRWAPRKNSERPSTSSAACLKTVRIPEKLSTPRFFFLTPLQTDVRTSGTRPVGVRDLRRGHSTRHSPHFLFEKLRRVTTGLCVLYNSICQSCQ